MDTPAGPTAPDRAVDLAPTPAATEFVADGFRWFGVDLTPVPHPTRHGSTVVAQASIDLAEAGLLTGRQRVWKLDPVCRLCLSRTPDGQLDYWTWGDLEFTGSLDGPLVRLGELALAADAIDVDAWAALLEADGIDPPQMPPG